jgi:hypothetical protein
VGVCGLETDTLVAIHSPSSGMAHVIGRAQVSTLAQKNNNAAVKL